MVQWGKGAECGLELLRCSRGFGKQAAGRPEASCAEGRAQQTSREFLENGCAVANLEETPVQG